ncbi:MAG: flagellar basal body rod protein FlgB, partial [Pseudomonadota bacterium]|nr:flagellar basal body rod protein FlgB [Pseudomonadota bacterium]
MLTDPVMQFYNTALNVRSFRQEILASDIANADTPYFQAKDVNFRTAFHNALNHVTGALSLKKNSENQFSDQAEINRYPGTFVIPATSTRLDGNTVNMNQVRAEFTGNALKYEATLTFMTQE